MQRIRIGLSDEPAKSFSAKIKGRHGLDASCWIASGSRPAVQWATTTREAKTGTMIGCGLGTAKSMKGTCRPVLK